jgi:hypothetical protein
VIVDQRACGLEHGQRAETVPKHGGWAIKPRQQFGDEAAVWHESALTRPQLPKCHDPKFLATAKRTLPLELLRTNTMKVKQLIGDGSLEWSNLRVNGPLYISEASILAYQRMQLERKRADWRGR